MSIGTCHPEAEWDERGTTAPLRSADVLAFFPFQIDAHGFVAAAYVMTRDLTRAFRRPDGTSAFDRPPERFRLRVAGPRTGAGVTASDPITGEAVPVTVVGRDADTLTVEVDLTDSPRLITFDERP